MRLVRMLLVVLVAVPLTGCLGIEAARVPAEVLDARGWAFNETASGSLSSWGGLARTELLVYDHPDDQDGYSGLLTIATQRSYLDPDEAELREALAERVRAQVESRGITIDERHTEGERTNDEGRTTAYFTYNATATEEGLFTRNAELRIVGEIWNCRATRTTIVGVGIAQVNDVRMIGSVVVPQNPDTRTWADLVADPDGTIEAHRGTGLLHRASCGDA